MSVVEWLTRGEALRQARANRPPPGVASDAARARELAEAADELRPRSVLSALLLDLEAITFAAATLSGERGTDPLHDLVDGRSLEDLADLPADELSGVAERARSRRDELVSDASDQVDVVHTLKVQRRTRLALLLVVAAVIAGAAAVVSRLPRRPGNVDLAAGKPWSVSSRLPECPLGESRLCGGVRLNILFHTAEEPSPWFEIDLGAPTTFSHVFLRNRDDCCEDRAVPLVVEVSDDRRGWQQVARQADVFDDVLISFPPTTARYVRLRVNRSSALHLMQASVYR